MAGVAERARIILSEVALVFQPQLTLFLNTTITIPVAQLLVAMFIGVRSRHLTAITFTLIQIEDNVVFADSFETQFQEFR